MSKAEAQQEAVKIALAKLAKVDLNERCKILGFKSDNNGNKQIRAFGIDFLLKNDNEIVLAGSGEPAKLGDQIIILHYLLTESPVKETEDLISFREIPSGQFYWEPFRGRTMIPLKKRIGDNVDLLKQNLDRFDWEPIDSGDFGAKVHAIGELYVTLVYYAGDEEFSADVNVLFDACIKRVFVAEDVVVIASRICIGLL